PRTRLIFELSWNVLDSPFLSSPSKSIRPLWPLAEIQLGPSVALTRTVTLSWGAAAMALSEGSGSGAAGFSALGVGEVEALGVAPSATLALPPSSPPLTMVNPTKPITATIAATMAAVQLGPRRSGRMRSASNSGAAGVGAGRAP